MGQCNTKSVYASVEACPGQRNLAGIRRRIYFVNKKDIASWPKLPKVTDENVTMGKLAQYDGDFTLLLIEPRAA